MIYYEFKDSYENNFKLEYDALIGFRKLHPINAKNIYIENHHIIPRGMQGSNDKSNLVSLTAREHFMAHYFLFKYSELEKKSNNFYVTFSAMNLILESIKLKDITSLEYCSKLYEEQKYKYKEYLKEIELENVKVIIDYYKKYNKRPNKESIDESEKHIGNIYTVIKRKRKYNILNEESTNMFIEQNCEELLYTFKEFEIINLKKICSFIDKYGYNPRSSTDDDYEKHLSIRLNNIKRKHKKKGLFDESIKLLKDLNYLDLLLTLNEKEEIKIERLCKFIVNNNIPNKRSKLKEERELGSFLSNLKQKYKNKPITSNIQIILNKYNLYNLLFV